MMQIILTTNHETINYAAAELKKYVTTLSRGSVVPCVLYAEKGEDLSKKRGVVLALLDELDLDTGDLKDAFIDDIIDIDVQKGIGYIAGSNPRSVLMGVYKYCTSAGCRFIRPGEDGDYVPHMDILNHSFSYRKKADYPFRGQAI